MTKNIKIIVLFAILIILSFSSRLLMKSEKYKKSLEIFLNESENSSEMYTGKIKPVYDPLDKAYRVSTTLEQMKENKISDFQIKHWPVISLWVDPVDLYSEDRGILKNTFKKGRLWERAAYLRYYKKGEIAFESYIGLRQHGNGSRRAALDARNFRMYFRKKYGEKSFDLEPKISFYSGKPIKRMVLRKETNINFRNDFSSYLLHALGGLGPKFEHTVVYLNGLFYGYYTMTAHLSFGQIKESIGHEKFVFAKLRGDMKMRDHILLNRLRSLLEDYPAMNFELVNKKVDIDSILGSLIVVMYSGNGDWLQGMYLKDLKNSQKWKYIDWDFDNGYSKNQFNNKAGIEYPFEVRSVDLVTKKKKGKIPWSIFNRLIHSDQKFRTYFTHKIETLFDILENTETQRRLTHYKQLSNATKDVEMKKQLQKLNHFIKHRKNILCRDLKDLVDIGPKHCRFDNESS